MIKANFKSIMLEFLGTFFITFVSSFGYTVTNNEQIDLNGLGLMIGFVIINLTWMAKNVTLAQFNPLITILLLILKRIKVIFYVKSSSMD